jgi:hypothetical protein
MKTRNTLTLAAVLVAAAAGWASAQTAGTSRVMRVKLDYAQKILEAVVTSNWQQLDAESRALLRVTQEPAWSVLRAPEYARHSSAFVRAADDLIEAARLRDLEAASLGFISLSTSCVSCHRYITRSRIVDRAPVAPDASAPRAAPRAF